MHLLHYVKNNIVTEEALIRAYEKKIAESPEGKLHCRRLHGKLTYYRIREDGTREQIKPENKELLAALRTKGYFQKAIRILKKNLKLEWSLLKGFQLFSLTAAEMLLPKAYCEDYLREWMKENYPVNNSFLEHKIYETSFGLKVRSKSEALIAELLYFFQIPFHYDEEVAFRDSSGNWHTFSIDFIIMTPSGEKIYWEHMGRFFDENYRIRNNTKIRVLYDNEIMLSNNLIITMESKEHPLNASTIDRIIRNQLLPFFEG